MKNGGVKSFVQTKLVRSHLVFNLLPYDRGVRNLPMRYPAVIIIVFDKMKLGSIKVVSVFVDATQKSCYSFAAQIGSHTFLKQKKECVYIL